jgi:emfourin
MRSTIIAAVVAVSSVVAGAPASAAPSATRVMVERSGGFAGRSESFVVDRSTAGGRETLRLAGSDAFRRLRGSYLPANACCDRFGYRVTVSWRGGGRKTVSTVQGARAPRVLWTVIEQTERYGVRPPYVR